MPAYSFQERFIPFLLDESKGQTIRKERTGRTGCHAQPGDTVYLYYGMRTKYCRKIGEAVCWRTEAITIDVDKIVLEGEPTFTMQSLKALDAFAWSDGFRPEGSSEINPSGAWELMLRFWRQTHELPFNGVVIYWKDFKPSIK